MHTNEFYRGLMAEMKKLAYEVPASSNPISHPQSFGAWQAKPAPNPGLISHPALPLPPKPVASTPSPAVPASTTPPVKPTGVMTSWRPGETRIRTEAPSRQAGIGPNWNDLYEHTENNTIQHAPLTVSEYIRNKGVAYNPEGRAFRQAGSSLSENLADPETQRVLNLANKYNANTYTGKTPNMTVPKENIVNSSMQGVKDNLLLDRRATSAVGGGNGLSFNAPLSAEDTEALSNAGGANPLARISAFSHDTQSELDKNPAALAAGSISDKSRYGLTNVPDKYGPQFNQRLADNINKLGPLDMVGAATGLSGPSADQRKLLLQGSQELPGKEKPVQAL